jgi:hypothetical protein
MIAIQYLMHTQEERKLVRGRRRRQLKGQMSARKGAWAGQLKHPLSRGRALCDPVADPGGGACPAAPPAHLVLEHAEVALAAQRQQLRVCDLKRLHPLPQRGLVHAAAARRGAWRGARAGRGDLWDQRVGPHMRDQLIEYELFQGQQARHEDLGVGWVQWGGWDGGRGGVGGGNSACQAADGFGVQQQSRATLLRQATSPDSRRQKPHLGRPVRHRLRALWLRRWECGRLQQAPAIATCFPSWQAAAHRTNEPPRGLQGACWAAALPRRPKPAAPSAPRCSGRG